MDPSCAVTGRSTSKSWLPNSRCSLQATHPLALNPWAALLRQFWAYREQPFTTSQHSCLQTTKETCTTYSTQHHGDTCECSSPIAFPPALHFETQSCTPQPSSHRVHCHQNRPAITGLCRPTLPILLTYAYLQPLTRSHRCFGLACFPPSPLWLRAGRMHTPDRARPVATFSVAQMSGLLQLHLNRAAPCAAAALHSTGTTGWDWTGWRAALGLAAERASQRAEQLSYCAARLASLSLSHTLLTTGFPVHLQISTHWPPRSIPTRSPAPPPQTEVRHLSLPPSSSLPHHRMHPWTKL
jgi:hypothetical protein